MVYVKDLKDQIGIPTNVIRDILWCPLCGNEQSANAGDYWNWKKDSRIDCACGEPFVLGHFVREFIKTKVA